MALPVADPVADLVVHLAEWMAASTEEQEVLVPKVEASVLPKEEVLLPKVGLLPRVEAMVLAKEEI